MKTRFSLTVLSLIVFVACSSITDEELMKKAEDSLASGDTTLAIESYEKLIVDRKESPLRAQALFLQAGIYQTRRGGTPKAVEYYRLLAEEYPSNEKAPASLFLVGFIYNNELKDLPKAKEAYEEFLRKYPDNEMAASAKVELQFLGKDATEILNASAPPEEKQKKSTPRASAK